MTADHWVNRVRELERAGRQDEAVQLMNANTTPELRQALKDLSQTIRTALECIPPNVREESREIAGHYAKSQALPEGDPKREAWEIVGYCGHGSASKFWRHLPNLKSRGRPPGSGKIVTDVDLLAAVAARANADNIPITRAAREVLGNVSGAKNKADHIKKIIERDKIEGN